MTKNRTLHRAFRLNVLNAALVFFAVSWMFSGIHFGSTAPLTSGGVEIFRYYTIDSNILLGVSAVLMARAQRSVLNGKMTEIPPALYVLKLAGVVGVTLTMLVTVFFLAPTASGGWWSMFSNGNLFMHLINPLLSLYVFLKYERSRCIGWWGTLAGIASVAAYSVFYGLNCILHAVDGQVPARYDWYGFAAGGLKSGLIMMPLLLLGAYGVCLGLWALNRRRTSI